MATRAARLEEIVGEDGVRRATAADSVAGLRPRRVVEPGDAAAVAGVLGFAREAGLAVVPRGGGSKLGWGNRPRNADLVLSTRRLAQVTRHAAGDLTATVQAGCTVAAFQRHVARDGQRLAVDPAWPERATIGGILATNDGGALRPGFGSLRDQLLGVTIALPDGRLATSGGRVVKNVAGYDLPKLIVGSLGTLGVLVEATFRLYPLPHESRTLLLTCDDAVAATGFARAVQDARLRPAALQLSASRGTPWQVVVRLESSSPAALGAQLERLIDVAREHGATPVDDGTAGKGGVLDHGGTPVAGGAPADRGDDGSRPGEPAIFEPGSVWRARERLGPAGPTRAVCKATLPPTELPSLPLSLDAARVAGWRLVAPSPGIAWLEVESTGPDDLSRVLGALRVALAARAGALVLAEVPDHVRTRVDAWGYGGDALPLMRRIKERFDPAGVLNPGRFVGGI